MMKVLACCLATIAVLLAGCGEKGGAPSKPPIPSNSCDWKLNGFEKIPKETVATEYPIISSDGKTARCQNEDACGAKGTLTPLMPGPHPHEKEQAKCMGKYTYTLKVEDCGTETHSGTLNQDSSVGWHSKDGWYTFSGMGVNAWTSTREEMSCAEVGWKCGCWGALKGESVKKVTGNLTIEVTMDTAAWPMYQVHFLAPPGSTGSKGSEDSVPVEAHTMEDNIDSKTISEFHPIFKLGPGAVFIIIEPEIVGNLSESQYVVV